MNRREILRSSLGVLGYAALAGPALPARLLRYLAISGRSAKPQAGDDGMIVYSQQYLTLEMPMSLLNSWITPVESFFVRNNLLMPAAVDPSVWTLSITGEVERSLTINFHDFTQLATSKVINTIECAGNSRVNFQPAIGGVRWGRGAVGNAAFEGPSLAAVLRLAGLKPTAKHVAFRGLDIIPPGASEFIRSIPIEKATERSTLLATKMNDSPLTPSHGFPARALVPGWIGSASIKWLQEIRVLSHEFHGFYMDPGYRIPVASGSGAESGPVKTISLTSLRVKSIIAQPVDGAVLELPPRRPLTIRGASWAGESAIARMEVSTDGGRTWHPAVLGPNHSKYAWRLWHYDWHPVEPGSYLILSRATDSAGRVQPMEPRWNPGGYLWNGVDKIHVQIRE
ncbi:MAG TPA: sulfite oxidase [Candidatus Acidoferrales bacterium]|nr:sulfite oxidase [Candidatus Acidoferrales bacterium]